jgi:hypothetical protein
MRFFLLYLILIIFSSFFLSCKKDKLSSPKASFLVANQVSLKTTPAQGVNTHKITDLWYYVNGQFKGVFPIGSVMPVVAEDKAEITLLAGIKNNGISATRLSYSFFNPITFTQNLTAGQTYTVLPEFEYNSNVKFIYSQNFDSPGSLFISAGDSAYTLTTDPTKTCGGSGGSIFMSMSDSKPTSKMLNSQPYYLPAGGSIVYLELNYKCNQKITVGVIGDGYDERNAIILNKSDDWNKIYIQLTNVVSSPPNHIGNQVFIKATKEVATPEIYIDNIKLITQ